MLTFILHYPDGVPMHEINKKLFIPITKFDKDMP